VAICKLNHFQSLGERSDLVHLYQHGISYAGIDSTLKSRRVGREKVVRYRDMVLYLGMLLKKFRLVDRLFLFADFADALDVLKTTGLVRSDRAQRVELLLLLCLEP
jgi:hypothetical protein